jgi:hypothetical protein
MSLLSRAFRATGRSAYLRAARRAVHPLARGVCRNGLARWYRGGIWFEEYPSRQASLVLNGHAMTLIGLYDLADLSPRAARLFRRGAATLSRALPDFDDGHGRSWYSLVHLHGFPRFHAPPSYDPLIVNMLNVLNEIHPHDAFSRYARAWDRG